MTLLLMVAGLFALILIDVPIAVALGVVAVAAIFLTQGARGSVGRVLQVRPEWNSQLPA